MAKNEIPEWKRQYEEAEAKFKVLTPLEQSIFHQEHKDISTLKLERNLLEHAITRVLAGADGKNVDDAPAVVLLSRLSDEYTQKYAKGRAEFKLRFPFADAYMGLP